MQKNIDLYEKKIHDILVTESGNVNLTAKVPSDPAEIEKLMA